MAMLPVRAGPGLAATVNVTVPLPVPLWLLVIVIHGVKVVAVHAQPAAVVSVTGIAAPPTTGTSCPVGLIVGTQPPACVTVAVSPLNVTVPTRSAPLFGVATIVTDPLPVPVPDPLTVSHGTWLAAVQEQLPPACSAIVADPPPAAIATAAGWTVYVHSGAFVSCCVRTNV